MGKIIYQLLISNVLSGSGNMLSMPATNNTRVYNLISVPQITRLLLEDAIISSKTEARNASKKENRSYGEARNSKAMLKILSLIRILYLRQQSNIL